MLAVGLLLGKVASRGVNMYLLDWGRLKFVIPVMGGEVPGLEIATFCLGTCI